MADFGALAHEVTGQPVQLAHDDRGRLTATRTGRVAEVLHDASSEIELRFDSFSLHVEEQGLTGEPERVGGAIARRRPGGRAYWTLAPSAGIEEWLELEEGVAFAGQVVASWRVRDGRLRALPDERGVHVLGPDGVPRVHVSAPLARDVDGRDVVARLHVDGELITLEVDAEGRRVLVDPLWVPTGTLLTARRLDEGFNIPVAMGGGVVWAGGETTGGASLRSVERYDVATGVWTSLPDMARARRGHVASITGDGRLLVAGGTFDDTAEIFSASLGTWRSVSRLPSRRGSMATSLLLDGRVLVSGGWTGTVLVDDAAIFDPATETWSTTGSIRGGRFWHTSTRMLDGRVLIAGGSIQGGVIASASIFDPAAGTWSSAGSLSEARCRPRAVLLGSGRVLVVGGLGASGRSSRADLYDPTTGRWTVTGSLATPRDYHSLTLLADGRVIAAGGLTPSGAVTSTTEIYDPGTGVWAPGPALSGPRLDHLGFALASGRVVVAGGALTSAGPAALDTSEILVEDECGDGILQAGEGCDDGNRVNGDCCSAACTVEVAGTVCRPGSGCDAPETCDGVGTTCPPDRLAPAGTVCRPAASVCDVAETCDGASSACPSDRFAPAGGECRASVGACDAAERCSGTSGACPTDDARPEGTPCGPAPSGPCDALDACVGLTGATAACAPRVAVGGTECRAASCAADVETARATCDGISASCPASAIRPCAPYVCGSTACLGTCGPSAGCQPGFVCLGGSCVPSVDAGVGAPDAGTTGADAGGVGRMDAGANDSGVPSFDAGDPLPRDGGGLPVDSSVPAFDGGVVASDSGADANTDSGDAGPAALPNDGCACRASPGREAPLALPCLVGLLGLFGRRRARSRAPRSTSSS